MDQGDDGLTGRDDLAYFGTDRRDDAVSVSRQLRIGQLIILSLLAGLGLIVLSRSPVIGRLELVEVGSTDGIGALEFLIAL